jgi:hypothetical protein
MLLPAVPNVHLDPWSVSDALYNWPIKHNLHIHVYVREFIHSTLCYNNGINDHFYIHRSHYEHAISHLLDKNVLAFVKQ